MKKKISWWDHSHSLHSPIPPTIRRRFKARVGHKGKNIKKKKKKKKKGVLIPNSKILRFSLKTPLDHYVRLLLQRFITSPISPPPLTMFILSSSSSSLPSPLSLSSSRVSLSPPSSSSLTLLPLSPHFQPPNLACSCSVASRSTAELLHDFKHSAHTAASADETRNHLPHSRAFLDVRSEQGFFLTFLLFLVIYCCLHCEWGCN